MFEEEENELPNDELDVDAPGGGCLIICEEGKRMRVGGAGGMCFMLVDIYSAVLTEQ